MVVVRYINGILCCLKMEMFGSLLCNLCLIFLFFIFLIFIFVVVVVAVRGLHESGTESEDSFVQTSHEDPLSCRECPFAGNFVSNTDPSILFFGLFLRIHVKEISFGCWENGRMKICVFEFTMYSLVLEFINYVICWGEKEIKAYLAFWHVFIRLNKKQMRFMHRLLWCRNLM